jgi:hypothetical protein
LILFLKNRVGFKKSGSVFWPPDRRRPRERRYFEAGFLKPKSGPFLGPAPGVGPGLGPRPSSGLGSAPGFCFWLDVLDHRQGPSGTGVGTPGPAPGFPRPGPGAPGPGPEPLALVWGLLDPAREVPNLVRDLVGRVPGLGPGLPKTGPARPGPASSKTFRVASGTSWTRRGRSRSGPEVS